MLDSEYFHDLLFLANHASAVIYREVVAAPEESLTGRVEKHACKQREAGGEGRSYFGLPKNMGRKQELLVRQAAQFEETKHPPSGCREDRRFGKKYVRRKKSKEHMDDSTSTLDLVQKPSSQREKEIYNNAETGSKSEQVVAVGGQEAPCSGMMKKTRELKKNLGSCLSETRQGKERACDPIFSDASVSEIEAEEDNEEAENTISEAALNQAVLGSDAPGVEEAIVSESEDFIPLLEEANDEKEEGVSNASRCNQWWNFKTRPRTSRGVRRHVQWRNKRKRNCMTFEDTQRNHKIILLAVEAITHQLGLLDVGMEEKSSYE